MSADLTRDGDRSRAGIRARERGEALSSGVSLDSHGHVAHRAGRGGGLLYVLWWRNSESRCALSEGEDGAVPRALQRGKEVISFNGRALHRL